MAAHVIPEGRLVYGMQLPVQAQSRTFAEPWERAAGPHELAEVARRADATGFFYVGVNEHLAIPRGPLAEHMRTDWYDTTTTLGFLAALTTRVRLLSTVSVLGFRHPILTAKQWATLDRLSGGRAILGAGVGWIPEEFAAVGADFERRGPVLDDAIDVVRACLRDEFPVVHTPTWSLDGEIGVGPRPIQPALPIWIGGRTRVALRRVAARGDGWIPQGVSRDEMPAAIRYLEEERSRVRPQAHIDVGWVTPPLYVGTPRWDVSDVETLSGTPAELAAAMRDVGDLGVDHLQIRLRSRGLAELLDQMDAWAADVAPLLDG
jgi:probable F420-dependent oxidoreductase